MNVSAGWWSVDALAGTWAARAAVRRASGVRWAFDFSAIVTSVGNTEQKQPRLSSQTLNSEKLVETSSICDLTTVWHYCFGFPGGRCGGGGFLTEPQCAFVFSSVCSTFYTQTSHGARLNLKPHNALLQGRALSVTGKGLAAGQGHYGMDCAQFVLFFVIIWTSAFLAFMVRKLSLFVLTSEDAEPKSKANNKFTVCKIHCNAEQLGRSHRNSRWCLSFGRTERWDKCCNTSESLLLIGQR